MSSPLITAILISIFNVFAKFKIFSSMSLYGNIIDPYVDLYQDLKLMKNVEYSAAVDQDELIQHYQKSAFFIHPARSFGEHQFNNTNLP